MNSNDRLSIPQSLENFASTEDLQQICEQKLSSLNIKSKRNEADDLTKQPIQQIIMSEKGFTFNHKNRFVTNPEIKQTQQEQEKHQKQKNYDQYEEKKLDSNQISIKQQSQVKQQKHFDEELNWGQDEEQHDHMLENQSKSTKNKRLDCSRKYFPKDQLDQPQQVLQQDNDSLNNAFFEQDEAVIMDDNYEEQNDDGEFQLLADASLKQELDTEKFYEKQEKQEKVPQQKSFLKSRFRTALKQDQLYTDQVIKQCRFNNMNNEEENEFENLFEALNQNPNQND